MLAHWCQLESQEEKVTWRERVKRVIRKEGDEVDAGEVVGVEGGKVEKVVVMQAMATVEAWEAVSQRDRLKILELWR